MKLKDASVKDLVKELLFRANDHLIEVSLHDTMHIMSFRSNKGLEFRVDIENEWPVMFTDLDKAIAYLSSFWKEHDRDTVSKT